MSHPLISIQELLTKRFDKNLVIIDASNAKNAVEQFEEIHLENAQYVDLDRQLAEVKENVALGGRHPLPAIIQFSRVLSALGIKPESFVVVYDRMAGSNAASRFWWMLKAAGHQNIFVLNGGFQAAVSQGYPLCSQEAKIDSSSPYPIINWQFPVINLEEMKSIVGNDDFLIIDVRAEERYLGLNEPIDLIAGHIPGAINIPFTSNLDENGFFLSPEQLKTKYSTAFAQKLIENIIIHCGSGVTACHTLLAIAHAGLELPRLYVGSWSEWSRNING